MKTWIALGAALTLWSATAYAEKGASIMFGDEVPSLKPQEAQSNESERCQELLREIDQLKGKPQRRITAQQRYEAECTIARPSAGSGN